jgi:hypothetical protein
MLNVMRTCPECRTRVLPTADGVCPARRSHDFDASVPESAVRAQVATAIKTERLAGPRRAASDYWRLQLSVCATLLLNIWGPVVLR